MTVEGSSPRDAWQCKMCQYTTYRVDPAGRPPVHKPRKNGRVAGASACDGSLVPAEKIQ